MDERCMTGNRNYFNWNEVQNWNLNLNSLYRRCDAVILWISETQFDYSYAFYVVLTKWSKGVLYRSIEIFGLKEVKEIEQVSPLPCRQILFYTLVR